MPSLPFSQRDKASTPKPGQLRRPPSSLGRPLLSPLPSSSETGAYRPNPFDPLDVAIAATVEKLPLALRVERLDAPLARDAPVVGSGMSAKYALTLADSPRRSGQGGVMCKLVDRVGPRVDKGGKKVLVRAGTGWLELELWALQVLAETV